MDKESNTAPDYPTLLRTHYEQADEDGVMVLASRQLIHEAADEIERLRAAAMEIDRLSLVIVSATRYAESPQLHDAVSAATLQLRKALSGATS